MNIIIFIVIVIVIVIIYISLIIIINPKSPKLEVGAQSAPKLPVLRYFTWEVFTPLGRTLSLGHMGDHYHDYRHDVIIGIIIVMIIIMNIDNCDD